MKQVYMKLEWGKKVICPICQTVFYDMRKLDVTCPNCKKSFNGSDLKKRIHLEQLNEEDDFIPITNIDDKSFDFEDNTNDDVSDDIMDYDRIMDNE